MYLAGTYVGQGKVIHTLSTQRRFRNDFPYRGFVDDLGAQRFLTVPEAAELLRVSVSDIHDLISSGELPALRVGLRGPWRIDMSTLEEFITQQYEWARRNTAFRSGEFANISIFPADF